MFNVGDLVVCVRDDWTYGGPMPPKSPRVNEICEIAGVFGSRVLTLVHFPSAAPPRGQWWSADHFRPIRKQSIQIFTDIANGVKQPEKENA